MLVAPSVQFGPLCTGLYIDGDKSQYSTLKLKLAYNQFWLRLPQVQLENSAARYSTVHHSSQSFAQPESSIGTEIPPFSRGQKGELYAASFSYSAGTLHLATLYLPVCQSQSDSFLQFPGWNVALWHAFYHQVPLIISSAKEVLLWRKKMHSRWNGFKFIYQWPAAFSSLAAKTEGVIEIPDPYSHPCNKWYRFSMHEKGVFCLSDASNKTIQNWD